jgi:cellulose synthase/poly-beta-1,6-N-acetylglucosamine synthase-like glycosyltransferase
MVAAFWLSGAFIAYVYAGYPALLWLWARVRPRSLASASPGQRRPAVSIVVAARNEGPRLAARIENLLHLDYPPARRQIIVVSDGSTDDTLAVLDRYRGVVDVVAVPAGGKALALNAGVRRAKHDVLVFADARQMFAADALMELTAPLVDPLVGAVTGELVLEGDSTIADAVGMYWRYEKQIRQYESAVGSMLGATGAIYAMRRRLWQPLPADTILDDVLAPMRAVLAGYRIVLNNRARAFDRTAPDAEAEARRKVRTLAGNYQILRLEPRLLLPWHNPVWLQYVSHKLGRLFVPYALLLLIASSMALAERSIVYAAALFGQCVFYLLAGYGAWLEVKGAGTPRTAPVAAWHDSRPVNRAGAVNA